LNFAVIFETLDQLGRIVSMRKVCRTNCQADLDIC